MIYIERFKFKHYGKSEIDPLRDDILRVTNLLNGESDHQITDEERPGLERHLAIQMSAHVTLQIRDAYLQVISRANGWENPWAEPDFSGFEGVTDEDLLQFLETHYTNKKVKRDKKRELLVARRRLAKESQRWHRPKLLKDRYEIIDGRMHEVRERTSLDGEIVREVNPYPIRSNSIMHRGKRISIAGYAALMTGVPISKPGPKPGPKRFRAQVRVGDRVIHLGMFGTAHERDAAVLTYRLGLGVNPSP